MRLLAYKGVSLMSRAIRFQTRSEYSHIAIELDSGATIEAWASDGVIERSNYREGHSPGTEVDVFMIQGALDKYRVEQFLRRQIGKGYDWRSVFRFIWRRPASANDRWFCSELAEAALADGFVTLLRGNKSHHSPRDTVMSPLLEFETTRVV